MGDVLYFVEDPPEKIFAQLTQTVERLILKENGVILRTSYFSMDGIPDDLDNPMYYVFSRIKMDEETGKEYRETFLSHNRDIATREWTMTNEETGEQTPIATEEIYDFLSRYPLLDIEMKPITDFPS